MPLVLVGGEHVLRQVEAADPPQPPEAAGGNVAAQGAQQRIAPIAVGDRAHPPGRGSRLDHAPSVAAVGGERLLAQHVGPGGEGCDRLLGVQVVGRADMDDLGSDGGRASPRDRRTVCRSPSERGAVQGPAAHGRDLAAQLADQAGVDAGDAAAADDGRPHQAAGPAAWAASAQSRRWSRRASSKPLRTGAPSTTLAQKPSSSRM